MCIRDRPKGIFPRALLTVSSIISKKIWYDGKSVVMVNHRDYTKRLYKKKYFFFKYSYQQSQYVSLLLLLSKIFTYLKLIYPTFFLSQILCFVLLSFFRDWKYNMTSYYTTWRHAVFLNSNAPPMCYQKFEHYPNWSSQRFISLLH